MKVNAKVGGKSEEVVALGTPGTLEELGVPRALAVEMEAVFKAMGLTQGDRVVGYEFRTPDGVRHSLRVKREETLHDRAA